MFILLFWKCLPFFFLQVFPSSNSLLLCGGEVTYMLHWDRITCIMLTAFLAVHLIYCVLLRAKVRFYRDIKQASIIRFLWKKSGIKNWTSHACRVLRSVVWVYSVVHESMSICCENCFRVFAINPSTAELVSVCTSLTVSSQSIFVILLFTLTPGQ